MRSKQLLPHAVFPGSFINVIAKYRQAQYLTVDMAQNQRVWDRLAENENGLK
jgi:hypothetical protein